MPDDVEVNDGIKVDETTILGIVEIETVVMNKKTTYPRLCYYSKYFGKQITFVPKFYSISEICKSSDVAKVIVFYEAPRIVNHVIYFYYPSANRIPDIDDFEAIKALVESLNIRKVSIR